MASTLTNLLYHVVFSTKSRLPLIDDEIRGSLYEYIGGIVRKQRGILLEIGGVADHVHILARFPASRSVSDLVKGIKSESSRWLNVRRPGDRFAWQAGFGAFSVSQSQAEAVRQYLRGQEEHHRSKSFKTEFLGLLKKHRIDYDERYLWQ